MTEMPNATMLADRALLRLSGEDVAGFLQGLVTQDVSALAGGPLWSGLLTPQGKALFDFILWPAGADGPDGDSILIDCEQSQRTALAKRLALYRLRRPIAIEPVDGAVHWSLSRGQGVPDPRLAALGYRWLGEAGEPTDAWLAHRLSLGVTEGIAELGNGETLWLECNARELGGVSFTKGCYIGQENTARMYHRSKVNRRLMVVPDGEPSDRTRARYPSIGLMVELRRVDNLGDAKIPVWLEAETTGETA